MIRLLERWIDARAERRAGAEVRDLTAQLTDAQHKLTVVSMRLNTMKQRQAEASGVKITMGRFGYEYNEAWRGKTRHETVERMLTDAHIEGALRSVEMPLRQAEWYIEPASDSDRDKEIAEFVASNLLRKESERYGREYWCRTSWEGQRLPEILRMLSDGYALFHTPMRVVGTKRVYDILKWLEPASVDPSGWVISDDDEIVAVKRTFTLPSARSLFQQPIPAEELMLYPWALIGARFEGRSMLRALYGAWSRKDSFLRAGVAWAKKISDGPPLGHAPNDASEEDKAAFAAFVHQLRGEVPPDLAGVFTTGNEGQKFEVGFVGSEFQDVDRLRSMINGENAEIAHGAGTKTQLLGETSSGSRAVGDSISPIEKMAVKAVANTICEWEMHGAGNLPGLVQRLVDENFAGVKAYPQLKVRNLDPDEKTRHIPELVKAIAAKAVPVMPEVAHRILQAYDVEVTIEDVKERLDADAAREEAARQQQAEALRQSQGTDEEDPQEDPQDKQQDEEPALSAHMDVRQRLGSLLDQVPQGTLPKNALRWPTRLETETVDLAGVKTAYREGEAEILATLRRVQRAMVDELVGRVRNGSLTARNVNGIRKAKFRGRDRMLATLSETLQNVAARGIEHVGSELERLQKRASLAVGPPKVAGYRIMPAAREELLGQVDTIAEIDLDRIWSRLLDQALPEFARMEKRGLTGDGLAKSFEDYLTNLSERPLEDLSREQSGRAYNEGRDAAIQTASAKAGVQYVMRSEVLDDNTCEVCRSYDGRIVEVDSDEYTAYMPPAGCEGGARCRGFYVLIPPEMAP